MFDLVWSDHGVLVNGGNLMKDKVLMNCGVLVYDAMIL